MRGQSTQKEMKVMKTSPPPIAAKPALMSQCRAYAWNMKLLEVACFYGHLQPKWSKIKFVWDFFMPVRLSEPLSTFHQCIVFCCSSSKAQSWPYRTGSNMVHPELVKSYQNIKPEHFRLWVRSWHFEEGVHLANCWNVIRNECPQLRIDICQYGGVSEIEI